MIFPFSILKKKKQSAEDIQFILLIVYHHRYGDVPHAESNKIADFHRQQMNSFRDTLPKSVLFVDMCILARDYSKIDIHFFPLSIQNISSNEEVKKAVKTLTAILKAQHNNAQINDPKEFFEL